MRNLLECLHSGRGIWSGLTSSVVLILAVATVSSTIAQEKSNRVSVPGSSDQWYIEGAERKGDAQVAEFLGRESLWLRNSTHVIRSGVEFVDGTIEFDVAPMDKSNFVGILFRRAAFQNQENIYLRIHRSGLYNAVQYAPRVNGSSTWQLYPEFNAVADLPRNQWTHVRVEVRGTKLEVYLNNRAEPTLIVPRLRGIPLKGSVAFWGRVNDQPATWAAALSNISIRTVSSVASTTTNRPIPLANTLTSWEVSGPLQNEKGIVSTLPELKEWRSVETEESGLVNLNRALGNVRGRWTGFARTTIAAERAKTAELQLGYSDDVSVFLNGEAVYSGINGFESRHPEYMGFVKPQFEIVHLKLRPGNNEIILAVTDDQRFGWGFIARLRD
ncbi:MAG TPA: hypothetical protein VFH31_18295 [Pyrinomonadaceae bacterium]|nr:hypothetical protein [Pyrinomonadaceae bacterium]